jgi:outer membrane protein OmpA-like peptidoglycan-associated protein
LKKTNHSTLLFIFTFMATIGHAQIHSVSYKMKNYTLFTNNTSATPANDKFLQGVEIAYTHGLTRYLDLYVPLRLGVPAFKSGTSVLQGNWGFDPSLIGKYDNGGFLVPYATLGLSGENVEKTWNWGALIGGGLNFRVLENTFLTVGTAYRASFAAQRSSWQHSLGMIFPVGGVNPEPSMKEKEKAINEAAAERLKEEARAKAQRAAEAEVQKITDKAKMEAEKVKMEAEAKVQAEKAQAEAEIQRRAAEKAQKQLEAEARAKAEKEQLEAEAKKKMPVTPPPSPTSTTVVTTNPSTFTTTTITTTTVTSSEPFTLSEMEQEAMTDAVQGVKFEKSSAEILKSSYGVLDKVVKVLKENKKLRLKIEGHTDARGNEPTNIKLSQQRASACMAYLVAKGISASRLTAKGFGSAVPIADNETVEGRAINRRVEFTPN